MGEEEGDEIQCVSSLGLREPRESIAHIEPNRCVPYHASTPRPKVSCDVFGCCGYCLGSGRSGVQTYPEEWMTSVVVSYCCAWRFCGYPDNSLVTVVCVRQPKSRFGVGHRRTLGLITVVEIPKFSCLCRLIPIEV